MNKAQKRRERYIVAHRVHTERQLPISGVHPIMMEKSALAGEGGGVHAHPLSPFYHHLQSFSVRSSWEGRYTTTISTLPYMYSVLLPFLICLSMDLPPQPSVNGIYSNRPTFFAVVLHAQTSVSPQLIRRHWFPPFLLSKSFISLCIGSCSPIYPPVAEVGVEPNQTTTKKRCRLPLFFFHTFGSYSFHGICSTVCTVLLCREGFLFLPCNN